MRPKRREQALRSVESRAVFRGGLSEESYQKLEEASGVSEIQEVLLEIFEPSVEDGGEETE